MHASCTTSAMDLRRESLKFESNRKLNLKEYKPVRKGIAISGIDVFVSTIKFIFTFVGDVKKTPKPRQLSVNHQLYDKRRLRSRQRSASRPVCDRRRPRPWQQSASRPVCDRRRPRPWQQKRQSPSVRQEAEAMATKCQLETLIEKEERRQKDAASKKR